MKKRTGKIVAVVAVIAAAVGVIVYRVRRWE
jgi:cytochrome c-type biogenesis protein CcmE